MVKKILFQALISLITLTSFAQLTPEYKYIRSTPAEIVYGLRTDYGATVVHTPAVKPIGGAHPIGFGFEISKQAKDSATYHKIRFNLLSAEKVKEIHKK